MAIKPQLEKLFQPSKIGTIGIRNRIVMLPMGTEYGSEDGYVTNRLKDYYEERAKGGVGLIIVEATCPDAPIGKSIVNQICIDDDKFIPGLSELAHVIKKHGAKAGIQLQHNGLAGRVDIFAKVQPVGPSVVQRKGYFLGRELTVPEIHDIITRFARAAERAKRAGFDGVEIQGGHQYLVAQFLSRMWNKRRDNYGAS